MVTMLNNSSSSFTLLNGNVDAHDHGHVNKYVMIVLYSLIGCISFVSNSLIFLIVGTNKKLWTISYFLLVSLAVTDWLIIVVGIPVHVINIYLETSITKGIWCTIYGFLIQSVFQCSMFNLSLISFHRYMLYVRRKWYSKIFGGKKAIFVVLGFAWLLPMLITSTPFYGFGRHYYDRSRDHCMIDWLDNVGYIIYIQVLVFPPNVALMTFCYIKILQKTKRRLRATSNDEKRARKRKLELRSTYMLLLVLLTSTLCFSPYTVTMFVEFFSRERLAQKYGFLSMFFCYSNSMFDFVIYNIMNKRFRRCFKKLLWKCSRRLRRGPPKVGPTNGIDRVMATDTTNKNFRTVNVTKSIGPHQEGPMTSGTISTDSHHVIRAGEPLSISSDN